MEQKKGKAGEQLKDKESSDCSSLLQSQSEPSPPSHRPGSSGYFSNYLPTPINLAAFNAEKRALDGWIDTNSAAEQLKDNKLSDCSSLPETPSEPCYLGSSWSGSRRRTVVSDHQSAPINVSTFDAEKGLLEGQSVTYTAGEQLKDNKLSDFSSFWSTPSAPSHPRSGRCTVVSDHQSAPINLAAFDAEKGALDGWIDTNSAAEQLKDNKLSDCSSLPETPSELNQPKPWAVLERPEPFSAFKDVSGHQRPFLYEPAPINVSTFDAEKGLLDSQSVTYTAAEQLRDSELSDFRSPSETASELSQTEPSSGSSRWRVVSGHQRGSNKHSLSGLFTDDGVSEYGSHSFRNPRSPILGSYRSLAFRTGASLNKDACRFPVQSENEPRGDHSALEGMGPSAPVEPDDSVCLEPSDSFRTIGDRQSSLSPTTSAKIKFLLGASSSPDVTVHTVSPDPPSCSFSSRLYAQLQSRSVPPLRLKRSSVIHHAGNKHAKLGMDQSKKSLKKEHSAITSTTDSSDYLLDQPPPGKRTKAGMRKKYGSAAGGMPRVNQDDTRDMWLQAAAGPSSFQLSTRSSEEDVYLDPSNFDDEQYDDILGASRPSSLQLSTCSSEDDIYDDFDIFDDEQYDILGQACAGQLSTFSSEGRGTLDVNELSEPGGDGDALPDMDVPVTAVNCSVTNTLPAHSHPQIFSSDPSWSRRDSSGLPRSHSMPSLSQITSPNTCRGAGSLPNMLLKTSFEEFTPDITDDEHDETYRFQCSGPGLYQCSVTGLVFHMEGEGVLVYRTVPWSRRLLVQHHKRPAGPLFDIKCVPESVCRLHLPHCEIRSTGGGDFLSVAHVTDEDVEFISPHEITETHVVINITGFSAFGNVKDEDSPADPVRALVLLFYRPPADPDPESLLNVLLLPRNVVLRDVVRNRKKLVGDERYIETSSDCKLQPKQEYSLATRPEDDSVLVQPLEAEFDCDNYDNYFPSFQVYWETIMKHIKLLLRDTNNCNIVWERRVCLSSTGGRRSALNLPPPQRLMDIRSSFVGSISGPVLKSLLDKLLEKKVIGDSEWGSADVIQNNSDKARFVIDTVRKKGEAASSEMIEFLCEADPFLCEHLGLT